MMVVMVRSVGGNAAGFGRVVVVIDQMISVGHAAQVGWVRLRPREHVPGIAIAPILAVPGTGKVRKHARWTSRRSTVL